ncbi:tyrosine-protein phosphatase non-receptor type 13 isoform X2 [Corythoichthys intestinalis]|uniref:tyrosine-protein phosphatase non-receptor type 13 isoform X2 n=1 Tax=Corythoichthys intestinalis TaxID=161448 RepID=UPI0025A5A1CE|nr:tyrosine-protein phosphatase non-receptor type 13 isoform X2 [Corythoichthys intestinalis]
MEQPAKDAASKVTSSDSFPRRFRHQRSATREGRKFQLSGYSNTGYGHHGDCAHGSKIPSIRRHLKPVLQSPSHESLTSQVPLTLQIKVSGQRDGLGISIAGGKGSLPYKDQDEGIFISRVTKGGPSEKAGVHVGDRLLEVNSLSMQGATHLEAVRALRNAGSRIRMKVLREGSQVSWSDETQDAKNPVTLRPCGYDDAIGQKAMQKSEDKENCLSKKKGVVCNGNGITDLKRSQLEAEDLTKRNDSVNVNKHTITIPRIILTHPSTSDEDVELLPTAPSKEAYRDTGIRESHVPLECFDSAFYPP